QFDAGNATRGQREVAIVVRNGQRVFGHDFGKVSPDLGTGIAHDRWWTRVETKVAGLKTRVYSLHLNAVIQQKDGRPYASRRWDVTREALEDLEKRWKEDIKDGWPVVIGGDFNWNNGREHARAHEMAPGRILDRLGLAFVNTELMWLAWTPKTHAIASRRSVPSVSIPGLYAGEHPALFVTLRSRGSAAGVQPEENGGGKDGDKNGGKNGGKDGSKNPSADDGIVKTADEIIQGFLERIQQLIDRVTQALKKITSLLSDTRRR
ncbi:MAG TPA: hypothetical protein VIV61_08635, partial [Candidatus Ozemobacteraceae bacterium]